MCDLRSACDVAQKSFADWKSKNLDGLLFKTIEFENFFLVEKAIKIKKKQIKKKTKTTGLPTQRSHIRTSIVEHDVTPDRTFVEETTRVPTDEMRFFHENLRYAGVCPDNAFHCRDSLCKHQCRRGTGPRGNRGFPDTIPGPCLSLRRARFPGLINVNHVLDDFNIALP